MCMFVCVCWGVYTRVAMCVLRKSSLFPPSHKHSGCRTERSLKHRAPAGPCVCEHYRPSFLHNPSCQTEAFQTISFHISNTFPSTRGHTLNQVTAARLSLTQKGHVNLSLQAVQTWMSCRFHRNHGCYF